MNRITNNNIGEALRKLQWILMGSSDYARVACILMSGMGVSPLMSHSALGAEVSVFYRHGAACPHGCVNELSGNIKGYRELFVSHRLSVLHKGLCEHVYADAFCQREFVHELAEILSRMDENSVVYYINGVHFTCNNCSTCTWTGKREQLERPAVSRIM